MAQLEACIVSQRVKKMALIGTLFVSKLGLPLTDRWLINWSFFMEIMVHLIFLKTKAINRRRVIVSWQWIIIIYAHWRWELLALINYLFMTHWVPPDPWIMSSLICKELEQWRQSRNGRSLGKNSWIKDLTYLHSRFRKTVPWQSTLNQCCIIWEIAAWCFFLFSDKDKWCHLNNSIAYFLETGF